MNRHLNVNGTVRSATELVAVIMEYEHALLHVTDDHDTCVDCQRVAQGALDGANADDFLEIAGDESTQSSARHDEFIIRMLWRRLLNVGGWSHDDGLDVIDASLSPEMVERLREHTERGRYGTWTSTRRSTTTGDESR